MTSFMMKKSLSICDSLRNVKSSNATAKTLRQVTTRTTFIDLTAKMITPMQQATRSSANAKCTARPSCLVGVLYDISREKIC